MNASTDTTRAQRWERYLADLEAYAAMPLPLASAGSLVRVAGLVLEAAGIRAPVGAVCEVHGDNGPPVQAEVVGFDGDRAFLMPTGEVHGLASGARVLPRPAPAVPPRLGARGMAMRIACAGRRRWRHRVWAQKTTRGAGAKTVACTCRWAMACSAAWSIRMARRWIGAARLARHI